MKQDKMTKAYFRKRDKQIEEFIRLLEEAKNA